MLKIERLCQIKNGREWETTHTDTDPESVLLSLSHDLIAKKINACAYIRSIKRTPNYNGTATITVNYDNNARSVYTIPE